MKSTTPIRYTGLVLFLTGFAFFIATFFLSSYQLTDDILKQALHEGGEGESESELVPHNSGRDRGKVRKC